MPHPFYQPPPTPELGDEVQLVWPPELRAGLHQVEHARHGPVRMRLSGPGIIKVAIEEVHQHLGETGESRGQGVGSEVKGARTLPTRRPDQPVTPALVNYNTCSSSSSSTSTAPSHGGGGGGGGGG